jgi:hypothetical protein
MNDRVQALAGSIYEEFEQVRNKTVIYRTRYRLFGWNEKAYTRTKCGIMYRVTGTSVSAECSWLLIDCDCEPVHSFFSSRCGSADNFFSFFDQKLQFTGEALKKEHPALKKMKFINFFLCLWVIFALRDPDPDRESGSGYGSRSRDPIESGSNPDPDPQHCKEPTYTLIFKWAMSLGEGGWGREEMGSQMEQKKKFLLPVSQ